MGKVNAKHPMSCIKLRWFSLKSPKIKLILCEGSTRVLKGRTRMKAGEVMFEFPDCVVCHADSFILGRPIPVLEIHDKLVAGHTYFVLPLDRLMSRGGVLSTASLVSLSSSSSTGSPTAATRRVSPMVNLFCVDNGGSTNASDSPFKYIKDKDGRVLMIKVVPEFITRIISVNEDKMSSPTKCTKSPICSTPELQKQYQQLVRAKDQGWSPKLETITEHKIRFSPLRYVGLEWKQKDKYV